MHRGTAKQYAMIPETWALEYARGEFHLYLPPGLDKVYGLTYRMDPIDVTHGLRRFPLFHTRYPYYLQDHVYYRSGDHQEPIEGKDLDLEVHRQDMHGCSESAILIVGIIWGSILPFELIYTCSKAQRSLGIFQNHLQLSFLIVPTLQLCRMLSQ